MSITFTLRDTGAAVTVSLLQRLVLVPTNHRGFQILREVYVGEDATRILAERTRAPRAEGA